MKPVLIEYFQGMRLSNSKHSFKRKQNQSQKQKSQPRLKFNDRDTPIVINRCDLCKEILPRQADNIQNLINVLDEIDDSFESEYDKHEPRLLLCLFCTKEYNIPSYL